MARSHNNANKRHMYEEYDMNPNNPNNPKNNKRDHKKTKNNKKYNKSDYKDKDMIMGKSITCPDCKAHVAYEKELAFFVNYPPGVLCNECGAVAIASCMPNFHIAKSLF